MLRPNQPAPEPKQPKRLADYTPPAYLIDEVDLNFDIRDDATTVTSKLDIRRNPDAAPGEPTTLDLDGEDLELVDIKLNGRKLTEQDYTRTDEGLSSASIWVTNRSFDLYRPSRRRFSWGLMRVVISSCAFSGICGMLRPSSVRV